jgi:hypothetical protein
MIDSIYTTRNDSLSTKDMTKKKCRLIEKALVDERLSDSTKIIITGLLLLHHNSKTGRCDPSEKTLTPL